MAALALVVVVAVAVPQQLIASTTPARVATAATAW
jgi:hypothetical protein